MTRFVGVREFAIVKDQSHTWIYKNLRRQLIPDARKVDGVWQIPIEDQSSQSSPGSDWKSRAAG